MPEMHLKQPGFTYGTCGPFTKSKKGIGKSMQKRNTDYIYKNDIDKACFQHCMAYGIYKDLAKGKESDKVLKDKPFKIASNPNYDRFQRGVASMVYKVFDKKSKGSGVATLAYKSMSNQLQLENELHKTIITKI